MSTEKLVEIGKSRTLTPGKQRTLWASALACRHFLVRAGLCTTREFKDYEDALLADLDHRVLENLKQTVGATDE